MTECDKLFVINAVIHWDAQHGRPCSCVITFLWLKCQKNQVTRLLLCHKLCVYKGRQITIVKLCWLYMNFQTMIATGSPVLTDRWFSEITELFKCTYIVTDFLSLSSYSIKSICCWYDNLQHVGVTLTANKRSCA